MYYPLIFPSSSRHLSHIVFHHPPSFDLTCPPMSNPVYTQWHCNISHFYLFPFLLVSAMSYTWTYAPVKVGQSGSRSVGHKCCSSCVERFMCIYYLLTHLCPCLSIAGCCQWKDKHSRETPDRSIHTLPLCQQGYLSVLCVIIFRIVCLPARLFIRHLPINMVTAVSKITCQLCYLSAVLFLSMMSYYNLSVSKITCQ